MGCGGARQRGALNAYVHLSSSQFLGLGSWYCSDCDLPADIGSDCAGCWESQPQASKVAKKKPVPQVRFTAADPDVMGSVCQKSSGYRR